MTIRLSRRAALLGLTSALSLGGASLAFASAPTDRRFVVVLLRGALDGLAAVVPYGDANLAGWRGELLPPNPGANGEQDALLDLGGFYGLNPALQNLHAMYVAGEAAPIHAVAGPYRSRSHFEAQDCMESGADHRLTSGWLNRVVENLTPRTAAPATDALAVGGAVPLLLRGPAPVGNWELGGFGPPAPDLYARIAALTQPDPVLGPAMAEGLRARGFFTTALEMNGPTAAPQPGQPRFPALAAAAGRLLAEPNGPRIAALELGGWDTHADQRHRLTAPLKALDAGLAALRDNLGETWRQTAVLVITEFGRTVRVNGTKGTDHGTATVAFALGGAIAGGRVRGDWPGLAQSKLFENRDLTPTTDVRAVAVGLLADHLGLPRDALRRVFPGSAAVSAMAGLVRV